jgi:tetratricopeptide (TPR) repeat protein
MRAERAVLIAFALWGATSVPAASAGSQLEAADRAFDAGRHDEALALYDDVLRVDPDNVEALVRSGMLLSWARRYDDAVHRYDRALEVAPRNPRAALERAKVLSWARRYDEAARAFGGILERQPDDAEARLGLARAMSWGGQQDAARREYETLLRREPGRPEALVGVAQTYAWSRRPADARLWYARALNARPGMKEALLGLAYLDLDAGELERAAAARDELDRRFPGDPEIQELGSAIRRAKAPWVQGSYDRLDDTDDNELETYRVDSGGLLRGGLSLSGGAARQELRAPSRSARVDSVHGLLRWDPAAKHHLALRAGADRREVTGGSRTTIGIGGIAYTWDLAPQWQLGASAQRDTFLYAVDILAGPGNTIEAYELSAAGRPAAGWQVEGAASTWDISDGNSRDGLRAAFARVWALGQTRFEAGYVFRWVDYSRDLDHGYFDPSDFTAHLGRLRAAGRFGSTRAYYDASFEAGVQSFTLDGVHVSDDQVVGLDAVAGYPVGAGVAVELFGARSDVALQSGTGFESRRLGLRVRWKGSER